MKLHGRVYRLHPSLFFVHDLVSAYTKTDSRNWLCTCNSITKIKSISLFINTTVILKNQRYDWFSKEQEDGVMLKNMQEENEGTDEGAVGGSTKKGTDAGKCCKCV